MSLNDALKVLKDHADAFRNKTGVTSNINVADMTKLLDDLKWGKENLLKGTSNSYRELTGTNFLSKSTANSIYTSLLAFNEGDWLTYSATISNTSNHSLQLETWFFVGPNGTHAMQGKDTKPYPVSCHSQLVSSGELDKQVSVSFQKPKGAGSVRTYIISQPGDFSIGETIKVKDERLYAGTEPGIWTPNPADKLGGVAKALLCALLSVRGCAA